MKVEFRRGTLAQPGLTGTLPYGNAASAVRADDVSEAPMSETLQAPPRVPVGFSTTALAAATSSARSTVLPKLVLAKGAKAPSLESSERPRYREHARLGVGGLGEVTLATDEDIGRQVAIKRLHDSDGEAALMRFVDEVQVMGRLDHPNIVPVHDVGCDEKGRLYFVMKRLEGETLEAVIERLRDGDPETHRHYPASVRIEIMMSILRALQFAHGQRTIHRDLKPSNIMLGKFGEVSVVDWGIAKRIDDPLSDALDRAAQPTDEVADGPSARRPFRTRVGALLGTPAYMSPEQARGDNHLLDERSDIFSVSVVFYELLTLHHPFDESDNMVDLLAAIRTTEPVFMPLWSSLRRGTISVALANFVHKGLQKQREDRYASAGEMIEALHDVVEGNFPVTCPVTLMKRSGSLLGRLIDAYPRTSGMAFMLATLGLVAAVITRIAHVWT